MKFTLLTAAAFIAGAMAAPAANPTTPASYDPKKCDAVKVAYIECKKYEDKDYAEWQKCQANADKQKKEYDVCIKIQFKFEADYKSCTKYEGDGKKKYDDCKKDEEEKAKKYNSCPSEQKPEYKKSYDDAKAASAKAYAAWKAYKCEEKHKKFEAQIELCKGEWKQYQAAKTEAGKKEAEYKKQVLVCKAKKIEWDTCTKKQADPKKPAGYEAPKGY